MTTVNSFPLTTVAASTILPPVQWTYSSTTTDADPGDGKFRLNNAAPASATAIYIDNEEIGGTDVSAWLDTFDDGGASTKRGTLTISSTSDTRIFYIFNVTGSVVDGTGYRKLTIAYIAGGGVLTDGHVFTVAFTPRTATIGTDVVGTADTDVSGNSWVLDEDDMASDSATKVPTQQSVKAYVDGAVAEGPIVILVTGQSNAEKHKSLDWTPPSNLFLWDYISDGTTVTQQPTEFVSPPTDQIMVGDAFGANVAKANPGRNVYVINVAIGGIGIDSWLPDPTGVDIWTPLQSNVASALTAIGVSTIDMMLWWQGENDRTAADRVLYIDKFEDVVDRFRTTTYFQYSTPILIFGPNTELGGGDADGTAINSYLQACVASDPDNRKFVSLAALPASAWEDELHMTAEGYVEAAEMAFNVFTGKSAGLASPPFSYDPVNGWLGQNIGRPLARRHVNDGAANMEPALAVVSGVKDLLTGKTDEPAWRGTYSFGAIPGDYTFRANGTPQAPTFVAADDVVYQRLTDGVRLSGGSSVLARGAQHQIIATESWGSNFGCKEVFFGTLQDNGATLVKKLVLDENGDVVIYRGVKFPSSPIATTDSNVLNRYESAGTWTPTVNFGGAAVGMTITTLDAVYVVIGPMVFLTASITFTAKGTSTGTAFVGGFPYASRTGSPQSGPGFLASNMASLTSPVLCNHQSGATQTALAHYGATGFASVTDTNFTDTSVLYFAHHYIAAPPA